MSGPIHEGFHYKAEEFQKPSQLPIVYLDKYWNIVHENQLATAYNAMPELTDIKQFIPAEILLAAGEQTVSSEKTPINISPEDFMRQMRVLGEQFVHPNIPTYFGTSTQLCMNLTAIMTNYLAEVYGFPVVGLYHSSDENLQSYIRPVSTVFDRVPQYVQFSLPHRYSLEDMIEVKVGNRIFAVDFNFWYGDERNKGMLVEEITTKEQRIRLGRDYGLWTTEFAGLNTADPLAVLSYMHHIDDDPSAGSYYLTTDLPPIFLMTIADEETLNDYRKNLEPHKNSPEFNEMWYYFLLTHQPSGIKVQDYIKRMSIGSLISQGHKPNELSGFGRLYIIPKALEQRRLLLHLPKPEDAITVLSK